MEAVIKCGCDLRKKNENNRRRSVVELLKRKWMCKKGARSTGRSREFCTIWMGWFLMKIWTYFVLCTNKFYRTPCKKRSTIAPIYVSATQVNNVKEQSRDADELGCTNTAAYLNATWLTDTDSTVQNDDTSKTDAELGQFWLCVKYERKSLDAHGRADHI